MKTLVLGATGHIGNAVAREMIARGHEVSAVSRRAEPALNLAELPVRYVTGNIDDITRLDSWIGSHDTVVDAAAPYPSRLLNDAESEANSIGYATRRTRNIIELLRKHRKPFAYVSSFVTLPHRRDTLSQWQYQLMRSLHPYFQVKELIETQLLSAAREGLPVVIVNPTLCLGPWDLKKREYCFVPALLSGQLPAAMSQVLNVVDVRDVARGLVAALETERYGAPILIAGRNISNDALFAWICELGQVRPPRIVTPPTLSVLGTYWTELALGAVGIRSPLPALSAMLTYMHDWLALSPSQIELGVYPRPLSESLTASIDWYRRIAYC